MIVGSDFPSASTTAFAISSEREEDVPTMTTTKVAGDAGNKVEAVETNQPPGCCWWSAPTTGKKQAPTRNKDT